MNPKHQEGSLAGALNIQSGDVIAFVGAGGKTILMLGLAEELFEIGAKVVVSTTAKMGTAERPKNGELIIESDVTKLILKAQSSLEQNSIPVLASRIDKVHRRLVGIEPSSANKLANLADNLLIEADGARQKSFKIPMAHEPVVPECVTKLCIVVGLDALGKTINEENFYNIEGMLELGAKSGDELTTELLRNLLFHPKGYLRFKSETRQIFLILNKYDKLSDINVTSIQELTDELFHNDITKILITSTTGSPIVTSIQDNSNQKISGVILAAGKGHRFDGVKQCAEVVAGKSLINQVTMQALASDLDKIVLVLGYKKDDVMKTLTSLEPNEKLTIIENPNYEQGMSTSLKAGLENLIESTDAVMFILGDQPRVTTELLNKLLDTYKKSNAQLCLPLVKTPAGDRFGNPVIISRKLYPELMNITGDIGAREVVKNNISYAKYLELSDDSSQMQINTREDLEKYIDEVS